MESHWACVQAGGGRLRQRRKAGVECVLEACVLECNPSESASERWGRQQIFKAWRGRVHSHKVNAVFAGEVGYH